MEVLWESEVVGKGRGYDDGVGRIIGWGIKILVWVNGLGGGGDGIGGWVDEWVLELVGGRVVGKGFGVGICIVVEEFG